MHILGVYRPADECLDPSKFVATNFEHLGLELCPNPSPRAVFSERPLDMGYEGNVTQALMFSGDATIQTSSGEERVRNCLVIDPTALSKVIEDQHSIEHLLEALWQMTCHELRHLVQLSRPLHADQMLGEAAIRDIQEANPSFTPPLLAQVDTRKQVSRDASDLQHEIDAIVISYLSFVAISTTMEGSDKGTLFDEHVLLRALRLTRSEYELDKPFWLDPFRE